MADVPVIKPEDNPERSVIIHGLARKRSETAGQIVRLNKQVASLREDLSHLDAVLAIWGFEDPDLSIRTKQVTMAGLFHPRELPRLTMNLLRNAENGLTCKQIAAEIMLDRGWDTEDERFQRALADKISRMLDKKRKHGRVDRTKGESGTVWKRAT